MAVPGVVEADGPLEVTDRDAVLGDKLES